MTKTWTILIALTLAACSAEATEPKAPEVEEPATAAVQSEMRHDPLACYARCTGAGTDPGICDTRCGCNGQCESSGSPIEMGQQ